MADAALLERVPLFKPLAPGDLANLATHLRPRHFARGDTIFFQGDPGTTLCLIVQGRVKLSFTSGEGREVIIDLLAPGEVFGELALLDGEPRSANAVTTEPTQLLMLYREEFLRFLLERPELAVELLGVLSRRLRRDAQIIQDAAFQDVPARLARTLLRLASPESGEAPIVTPRLTQTDLAGLVGTTRETLNKWQGSYQDEGWIRLEKGRIKILQAEALRHRIA